MKLNLQLNRVHKNDLFLIISIFALSHIWILFNDGFFWDDWVWILNPDEAKKTIDELGNPFLGYIGYYLISNKYAVILNKLTTFLFQLGATIAAYKAFQNIFKSKDRKKDAFWLSCLFGIFPVFFARNSLSCTSYSICYFLFFYGLSIVTGKRISIFKRIISLIVFFLSFSMNSLLVLYVVVPFCLALNIFSNSKVSIKGLLKLVVTHLDFMLLPILFWIVKNLYFISSNYLEGYNTFTLGAVRLFPLNLIKTIHTSFLAPISYSLFFSTSDRTCTSLLIAAVIILAVYLIKTKAYADFFKSSHLKLSLVGVVLFIIGVTPYLLVNKLPHMDNWLSRHQILTPLGASFFLYFFLKAIFSHDSSSRRLTISLLIVTTVFSISNLRSHYFFQKDWLKQLSIVENMKESIQIKNNSSIWFEDDARKMNATRRTIRSYEYTGMMKTAYNDQKRIAVTNIKYLDGWKQIPKKLWNRYHFKDYTPSDKVLKVSIVENGNSNFLSIAGLLCSKTFNSDNFQRKIKELVTFKYKTINR